VSSSAVCWLKAFDSNTIIAELHQRGAKIVISQHPRRAQPLVIDAEIYEWRHLIENLFCKLKEFKRIAMRSDKTDRFRSSQTRVPHNDANFGIGTLKRMPLKWNRRERQRRSAPSPLVGEGWGGGS
jgi:hypothetical protein